MNRAALLGVIGALSVACGGANGANGADGADGADGREGPRGGVGAVGAGGARGEQGAAGKDGATGATGATGAAGEKGGPEYRRTVVVSPVPGDALASGRALVDALGGITAATADDRWLVAIEPGTFDLAGVALPLRDFVDVQGAGERATTLVTRVEIRLATSELRSLRIEAHPPSSYSAAALCTGGLMPTIRDVTLALDGVTNLVWGIDAYDCPIALTRVTVAGTVPEGAPGGIFAMMFSGAFTPQLDDVNVQLRCDGTDTCLGLAVRTGAVVSVRGSRVDVGGTGYSHQAIWMSDAELALDDVAVTSASSGGYGILGSTRNGGRTLRVDHSSLEGDAAIAFSSDDGPATTLAIGDSRLTGRVSDFGSFSGGASTVFLCGGAYDGAYRPLDATCHAPRTALLASAADPDGAAAARDSIAQLRLIAAHRGADVVALRGAR